jgi:hypothetical protein
LPCWFGGFPLRHLSSPQTCLHAAHVSRCYFSVGSCGNLSTYGLFFPGRLPCVQVVLSKYCSLAIAGRVPKPTVSLGVTSAVVSSCGHNSGQIELRVAH